MDLNTCNNADNTPKGDPTPSSAEKSKIKEYEILKDVVAFVDVRCGKDNWSDAIAVELIKLGATVVDSIVPEVTHVVFKGGFRRTYTMALRRKIHIVNVFWIDSCRKNMCKENEELYTPEMPQKKEQTPIYMRKFKKYFRDENFIGSYSNDGTVNTTLSSVNTHLPSSAPGPYTTNNQPSTSSQILTQTPQNGRKLRKRAKKPTSREISTGNKAENEDNETSEKEDEDYVNGIVRNLFNRVDTPNGLTVQQAITESMLAIKRRYCYLDYFRARHHSPISAVSSNAGDDEGAYIPLMDRCKARILAEQRMKNENMDNQAAAANTEEAPKPQDFKDTKTSDDQSQTDLNVSEEVINNKKRRGSTGSTVSRDSKRVKLNLEGVLPSHTTSATSNRRKSQRLISRNINSSQSSVDGSQGHDISSNDITDNKDCPVYSIEEKHLDVNASDQQITTPSLPDKCKTPKSSKSASSRESETDLKQSSLNFYFKKESESKNSQAETPLPNERPGESKSSTNKSGSSKRKMNKKQIQKKVPDGQTSLIFKGYLLATGKSDRDNREEMECTNTLDENVLVSTNLHKWETQILKSAMSKLGRYRRGHSIPNGQTIIVTGDGRRTIKILMAISLGCWIVDFDWVKESERCGRWLSKEDFEANHYFPAARENRLERLEQSENMYSRNLFSGCGSIFVAPGCDPDKEELTRLIVTCRGRVVQSLRLAEICVGGLLRKAITNVSAKWVLDSITENRCLETRSYLFK